MIIEKRFYPPDVGSEVDWPCGCQTWTSRGAFIMFPCSTTCPNYLSTVAQAQKSMPVENRSAWSR